MNNNETEKFWDQLKDTRDELRVRAYLAKREIQDEWEVVEEKWHVAEKKLNDLKDDAIESTLEMKNSAHIIMEEISSAYDRIKKRLND